MAVRAKDVAEYILRSHGEMSAMKLQKLLYYCQAWHAVWEDEQLFPERIEAWAHGPVVRDLYAAHRGQFRVSPGTFGGDANALEDYERESVDIVLNTYADKDAQWLRDLTHMEDPWRKARVGLEDGERGESEISVASMFEYYSGL